MSRAERSIRILLLDDASERIRWVVQSLHDHGERRFTLIHAPSLPIAQMLLTGEDFDAVVADLSFFLRNGQRLGEWVRRFAAQIPLLLLIRTSDEARLRERRKPGVLDYLLPGVGDPRLLVRTLDFNLEHRRLSSELAELSQDRQRIASRDPLTGLVNRSYFRHTLERLLAPSDGGKLAIMFVDLDRFKGINDSLGHAAGDELLRQMSRRLSSAVRGSDTVARLGGDEFGCLLPDIGAQVNARKVAQQVLNVLSQPLMVAGREVACTPSIGIALYADDGETVEDLLKHADAAMLSAKKQGGCFRFFNPQVHAENMQRLTLESELRHALPRGELSLHYQPIVDAANGRVCALEALLRWEHAHLGMVSPQDFIPLAEAGGLITTIGRWVLHTACAQNLAWQAMGLAPLRVAVNLSPHQFGGDDSLVNTVREVLEETGLAPQWLELEITESAAMANPTAAIKVLGALRGLGVRVAMDDFGTGYSSLSYLQRLPIDTLKIDRSFVSEITANDDSLAITRTIVDLARSLGLKTVAEGVEKVEQVVQLQQLQCTYLQGFHFSRPLDAEAVTAVLRGDAPRHSMPAPVAEASDWSGRISEQLAQAECLPPVSDVAQRLLLLMNDPNAHAGELSSIVEGDPALAAQVIRYANAPFFGFQGRIESVQQAVVKVLGYDGVMGIALGLVSMGSLRGEANARLVEEDFWWQAVAASALAQALASQRGLRRRVKPGLAYLAALLRDIGHLFLVSRFPAAWDALRARRAAEPEAAQMELEQALLGTDHAAIGAELLRQWRLPAEVIAAVAGHHQAGYSGDFADYVHLLQLVDRLLRSGEVGLDEAALVEEAGRVGLEPAAVLAAWERVLEDREGLEFMVRQLAA